MRGEVLAEELEPQLLGALLLHTKFTTIDDCWAALFAASICWCTTEYGGGGRRAEEVVAEEVFEGTGLGTLLKETFEEEELM